MKLGLDENWHHDEDIFHAEHEIEQIPFWPFFAIPFPSLLVQKVSLYSKLKLTVESSLFLERFSAFCEFYSVGILVIKIAKERSSMMTTCWQAVAMELMDFYFKVRAFSFKLLFTESSAWMSITSGKWIISSVTNWHFCKNGIAK